MYTLHHLTLSYSLCFSFQAKFSLFGPNSQLPGHYANNCTKPKKKIYAIDEESVEEKTGDKSDSDSMGNGMREESQSEPDTI